MSQQRRWQSCCRIAGEFKLAHVLEHRCPQHEMRAQRGGLMNYQAGSAWGWSFVIVIKPFRRARVQFRALTVLAQDQSSVPSTHTEQHSITYNFSVCISDCSLTSTSPPSTHRLLQCPVTVTVFHLLDWMLLFII